MDQNTHCNMGYGYVNMINADAVIQMYENVCVVYWLRISSTIADGPTQRVWRFVQFAMDVCKVVLYHLFLRIDDVGRFTPLLHRLVSDDFQRKVPSIILQTQKIFCEWKGSYRDDSFQTTYWSFHAKDYMMFPLLIFLFVFCVLFCSFFFSYGLCFFYTILCVFRSYCDARGPYYTWDYTNEEYWW